MQEKIELWPAEEVEKVKKFLDKHGILDLIYGEAMQSGFGDEDGKIDQAVFIDALLSFIHESVQKVPNNEIIQVLVAFNKEASDPKEWEGAVHGMSGKFAVKAFYEKYAGKIRSLFGPKKC